MKETIETEAAEWLVRKRAGMTREEERAFAAWRDGSPERAREFDELSATWELLEGPKAAGFGAGLAGRVAEKRGKRVRRRWQVASGGVVAVAVVAISLWWAGPRREAPVTGTTVAVRPDRQVLPDGSKVELNRGAEIAVEFTSAVRAVRMVRGEALFQVAKDAAKPFVVSAGTVSVRAVGTAFTVRNAPEGVRVLVTEGRVAVERPGDAKPVYLGAGENVLVAQETPVIPAAIAQARVEAELAWRGRRVEFTDTPLSEAVALFNRTNVRQLRIAEGALRDVRLNGIFWADDPEGFARLLERGENVKVERANDGIVLR